MLCSDNIPLWAKIHDNGKVEVDPDIVYPLFLDALGYNETTQEALETCRMVFTKHLHNIVNGNLHLVITYRPRWALHNFKHGIMIDYESALYKLDIEGRIPG